MAEVKERAALVPPGGVGGFRSDERFRGEPGARVVVMHSPGGHRKGSLIDVHEGGFAIGGADDDVNVAGTESSGTRLQIDWVGLDVVTPRPEWRATATGRVRINDEIVGSRILRAGDRLRVVDTFFRFLCGQNMEKQFHEAIYFLTISDVPTGLHNARFLEEALGKELERAEKRGTRVSVAALEFQADGESDASSHDVLGGAVKRIRQYAPRQRVAARNGELELVIVSPEVRPERVREELAEWLRAEAGPANARIWCGVAESSAGVGVQGLIAKARSNARPLPG